MARRKAVLKNPVGDSDRFYGSTGRLGKKRTDKARKGTLPTVSKYPDLTDIYAMIDSVTKEQIRTYANATKLPVLIRDLLFEFAEDWANLDRDHANYLSQIPKGYPSFEAALIGDLLYWMITGANESSKLKQGNEIRNAEPWPDTIAANCPNFKKRMDSIAGLSIHDLPGLQIRLLNNLPINSYNRYTIAQVTLDDPQIGEQVFPTPSPLDAEEHDALLTLKRLVETGDIKKFSVALMQSSREGLIGIASSKGVGSHIFQAFEMAKNSVDAYNKGDINLARKHLEAIQDEYKMNLATFQTGLKDMFVITASAFHLIGAGGSGNARVALKGSPEPLLVSLDTSMPPTPAGWPKGRNMHHAMKQANQVNVFFNKDGSGNKAVINMVKTPQQRGTLGLSAVSVNQSDYLTTYWLGIFQAALSKEEPGSDAYFTDGKDITSKGRWPDADSFSLRFVIHANLSIGIGEDFLVPKGLLTVTVRRETNKTWADSINSFGGGGSGSQRRGRRGAIVRKKGGGRRRDRGSTPSTQQTKKLLQPIIDLFVEDLGRATDYSDAITIDSLDEAHESMVDLGTADIADMMEEEVSMAARGAVKDNPSGARGKAIAIDVVPRSQIEVRTITEKHSEIKYLKQVRDQEDLGELYKQYGTGQIPTKYHKWRGKTYASKKKASEAAQKSGTQVDKGHPKMQILYARRKDNGNLVPHRIILPRIMARHDLSTGRLVANKGSKAAALTRRLLKRIEKDFGPIMFQRDLADVGGFNVVKSKDSRGKVKSLNYNRGIAKLFEAEGHDPGVEGASRLHVSQIALNGVMHYEARLPGGKRMGPVALRWGIAQ